MLKIEPWDTFDSIRKNSRRKLIIYDNEVSSNAFIYLFGNDIDFFCSDHVSEKATIEWNQFKFPVLPINDLNLLGDDLDIVVYGYLYNSTTAALALVNKFKKFKKDVFLFLNANESYNLTYNGQAFINIDSVQKKYMQNFEPIYQKGELTLKEYFNSILSEQRKILGNGLTIGYNYDICQYDYIGKYINIKMGKRITAGVPSAANNNIHIYGDSRIFGSNTEDQNTIASLLQHEVNTNNHSYKVINHGAFGLSMIENIYKLRLEKLSCGDIVIICSTFIRESLGRNITEKIFIDYIFEMEKYCAENDARFIYVNLPSIYDIENNTDYEKEIILATYISNTIFGGKSIKNDEVILLHENLVKYLNSYLVEAYNLIPYINQNRNKQEIFFDASHYFINGNKIIAQTLYDIIFLNNRQLNKAICIELPVLTNEEIKSKNELNKQFKLKIDDMQGPNSCFAYLKRISSYDINNKNQNSAIVMNCNPFTNGHKYLIEYAAANSEFLYIFVVEEDKSYFKFEDRFHLVKENTKHLNNAIVVPSGKYIISTMTFPEYFTKSNTPFYHRIDATNDILFFASFIAPSLNIQKRFVGNEPFCGVTNQYNEQMKKILPLYNIELIEIPRIKFNDEYISASQIRELIKNGEELEIQKRVPNNTFSLIKEKYM